MVKHFYKLEIKIKLTSTWQICHNADEPYLLVVHISELHPIDLDNLVTNLHPPNQ